MPGNPLAPWHDFFTLIGSAAATLVGLMFVAASVGSGVFTTERQAGMRTFLSPTVVAFTVVLAASLVGVLPPAALNVPGLLLAAIGVSGALYSALVWRRMVREGIAKHIDLEDRIWYALVPALAYAILTIAGTAFLFGASAATALMPLGMCLLLLAGIRNAWDMTTWVVLRRQQ